MYTRIVLLSQITVKVVLLQLIHRRRSRSGVQFWLDHFFDDLMKFVIDIFENCARLLQPDQVILSEYSESSIARRLSQITVQVK